MSIQKFPAIAIAIVSVTLSSLAASAAEPTARLAASQVMHRTVKVQGLDIFYREAGPKDAPTVLLLHGFPTSSHMFRNLIPALSDKYHVVAPDYPGYGNSSAPSVDDFEYTFDNIANIVEKFTEQVGLTKYSIYLMDYGAPVGLRMAAKHPERVEALIVQNGNAYAEGINNEFWAPIKRYWSSRSKEDGDGLRSLLTLGATKWQYTEGVRNVEAISPDTWGHVQPLLDRLGNQEIQLAMFYSYGSNPPLYAQWQEYFRTHQPPTLVVWGKNDKIFPAAGAHPYRRDLKNLEFHLLDTGHFALEEDGDAIAKHIRGFLGKNVGGPARQVAAK
ncbi:MAG: alpha/beta fold hydrolase [Rubripirellula sp.]